MSDAVLKEPIRDYLRSFIKMDDELIEHLLKACFSAETNDPLNLVVIAPTSEGKTFSIVRVTSLFPNAITFDDASSKSFFYDNGVLVDKDGRPIQTELDQINADAEKDNRMMSNAEKKRDLRDKRRFLLVGSMTRINFDGKILVFLDAPRHDLWAALKPLLSHDKRQMLYQTVDKSGQGSTRVRKILLEGWPASVFATARDEDQWQSWPEIKSRVIEVSPNMDPRKYLEANRLTSVLMGQPSYILRKRFPESAERQAKDEVERIRQQIQEVRLLGHSEGYTDRDNFIFDTFAPWLDAHFPHESGPRMRQYKTLLAYINLSAYENIDSRPKLVIDGHSRAIMPTWVDVTSSLKLILKSVIGSLPEYKIRFWHDYILPAYEAKARGELIAKVEDGKLVPIDTKPKYELAALTSEDIRDYAESKGYRIGPSRLSDTFLKSLIEMGYVKANDDPDDKRRKLYTPVRAMEEMGRELTESANASIIEPEIPQAELEKLQLEMSPDLVNYLMPGDMKHEAQLATNLHDVACRLVNGVSNQAPLGDSGA